VKRETARALARPGAAKPAKKIPLLKGSGPFNVQPEAIAANLEDYRARYVAGDKAALLEAVGYCLFNQVVAPHWIVRGFLDATGRWQALVAKTLDEAFGVQRPKRKRLGAAREKAALKFEVYSAVESASASKDDLLFQKIGEQVAEKFNLSRPLSPTRVKEYLAAARQELKAQVDRQKRLNPSAKIFINTYTTLVRREK
jgi:hypothetical protein